MSDAVPLQTGQLESRLDRILEVEFTFRETARPAREIATLGREEQEFLLDWIERVASTNLELGYQVACHGLKALSIMDRHTLEAWALHVMDLYDSDGLRPALQVLQQLEAFVSQGQHRVHGAVLSEIEGVLSGFLQGLSGRRLKLAESDQIYTDTETLYLPPVRALLESSEENFLHYKITCTYLWAQVRFGSFRALRSTGIPQADLLALFHAMETLRLEACIARELPGLHREMQRLKRALGESALPGAWRPWQQRLAQTDVDADQVMAWAAEALGDLEPFEPFSFQGSLQPEPAFATMQARAEREKALFRVALKQLSDDLERTRQSARDDRERPRFTTGRAQDEDPALDLELEIQLDGRPLPIPEGMADLKSSIIMDFGEIPDDYLEPAGAGEYDPGLLAGEEGQQQDVWSGTYHEEGAHLYREWDYRRKHYRKNWCAVREREVTPVYDNFVAQTLERYSGLVKHLRKTFEAMRDEDRLLKRQTEGDGVDIDALVEALADHRVGGEMSDRLFTRMHRSERSIAVIFMVDMSGSTKGWINDAERESLVLLCEALESLGDRYAIYGFSSLTRKRCELYRIKAFEERYDEEVKSRISGIRPQDYTRMGFAIRHLSALLKGTEAKTRVLVTLSDGKPDDYDSYRGEYGIEDTRRALLEARRDGIHPYCITIDEEARSYLPHLYGPAAYTLVDEVARLPLKVSDIYRRLTS